MGSQICFDRWKISLSEFSYTIKLENKIIRINKLFFEGRLFELTFLLNFEHVRPLHRVSSLSEVRLVLGPTRKDRDYNKFMQTLIVLIIVQIVSLERIMRIWINFGDVGKLWLGILMHELLQNIINL